MESNLLRIACASACRCEISILLTYFSILRTLFPELPEFKAFLFDYRRAICAADLTTLQETWIRGCRTFDYAYGTIGECKNRTSCILDLNPLMSKRSSTR